MLIEYSQKYRDQCCQMFLEIFTSEQWGFDWLVLSKVESYMGSLEATPGFLGFVLLDDFDNNQVSGFCLGVINEYANKQYEIKEIFVDLKQQSKGLGSELLAEVENFVRQRGVTEVSLLTSNFIPAYGFYLKNGYSVRDTTVQFVKRI